MRILITVPSLQDQGGVSNYYKSISGFLTCGENRHITFFQIGSSKRAFAFLYPLMDQIRFLNKIYNGQYDLVCLNPSLNLRSFIRDGLFVYFAIKRKLPVVIFFHGWLLSFESKVKGVYRWFFEKTYGKANCFIVLASDFKDMLMKWGVKAYIFIETTAINDELSAGFSISNKLDKIENETETKILFLSRIEKTKGVIETLEAFKILINRGVNVSLSIAGDGAYMNKVKDYIASHDIVRSKVVLLGYVDGEEKKSVFESHHIFCLPTYSEGMPISMLEAMYFGLPILTRMVGGIKDFFVNGKMGYVTKMGEPEEIADLLEKLIKDKEKLLNMGLYNHNYAIKHFLASAAANRLINIFRRMYAFTG
jgi:glycosyltransferase involved in cell wall biosynthesis